MKQKIFNTRLKPIMSLNFKISYILLGMYSDNYSTMGQSFFTQHKQNEIYQNYDRREICEVVTNKYRHFSFIWHFSMLPILSIAFRVH